MQGVESAVMRLDKFHIVAKKAPPTAFCMRSLPSLFNRTICIQGRLRSCSFLVGFSNDMTNNAFTSQFRHNDSTFFGEAVLHFAFWDSATRFSERREHSE